MGEKSKLDWLIVLVQHVVWDYSLYFMLLLLLSVSKILASFQPTHDPLHRHVGLEDPLSNCDCVHGATRLEFYLFRQCSFCHIHKGKDIPVTGRGGPKGCERSRLPHFLDKRLIYGSKVVSPTRRPPFTPLTYLLTELSPS
jgi:hypothetical protein